MKNCSGEFFNIKEKDSSFRGKGLLENGRILGIMADARKAITTYHDHLGDDSERKKCLDQIMVIIPHHCGDHSSCNDPGLCQYSSMKKENPDWTDEQIQHKVAETSLRHEGTYMDLSEEGCDRLMKVLMKRFNLESID